MKREKPTIEERALAVVSGRTFAVVAELVRAMKRRERARERWLRMQRRRLGPLADGEVEWDGREIL